MKKIAIGIFLTCLCNLSWAASFPSFESAQKYYLEILSKSEGKSFDVFVAEIYGKPQENSDVDTTSLRALYDSFIKAAGPLTYCECLKTLSLGSRLKKSGFLIKHKSGATFVEMIFFKDEDGWKFVNWNMQFNADTNGVLSKIPEEYWQKE